jgi:hypothetical protein
MGVDKKMALRIIGNVNHGTLKTREIKNVYMTDSEAGYAGRAYKLSSGRWTQAVGTDRIYAICFKATTLGTDVLGYMEMVKPGDIIEADYTGTADATFLPGCESATLGNATGASVDASDVTSGHLSILEVDTTNTKVRCLAVKNYCVAS